MKLLVVPMSQNGAVDSFAKMVVVWLIAIGFVISTTIAVTTAMSHKTAVSNFYWCCSMLSKFYVGMIQMHLMFCESFQRERWLVHLLISAYNCELSKGRFLCNDNSSCIPLNDVCNGKPDCPKGDDESSSCPFAKEECNSNRCPKEAKCHYLPSGSVCICPKGYHYNATSAKCEVSINLLVIKWNQLMNIIQNLFLFWLGCQWMSNIWNLFTQLR